MDVTVPSGNTVTVDLSSGFYGYIISSMPDNNASIFLAVGCGYSKESIRHKINVLIASDYLTVSPSDTNYGIVITNSGSRAYKLYIAPLQL